ncbi:helix-turn-helix domain-containing protein [Nonomuraea wenchangensis]|uniref:helix-turn-helix domain-containing protein n=1 Tax=Nonomuraea wenchangensis TaxID=568860 RepID=UPI0037163898
MDARGSIAHWISQHAHEDALKGRPLPPGLAALVQQLLQPRSSPERTKQRPPATVEISTAEQAARMGCTERYVQRLCQAGRLPARRIGRTWLITQEDAHDDEDERPSPQP